MLSSHKPIFLFLVLSTLLACESAEQPVEIDESLASTSTKMFTVAPDQAEFIIMSGFVEFDERIEVATSSNYESCYSGTYEFRFEYDTTVFVEFRDGMIGNCSYGAIITNTDGVMILAEEEFPLGTQMLPFIQYHQNDPHIAVFQIGTAYFVGRASDLREVAISCRRDTCEGSIERRTAPSI